MVNSVEVVGGADKIRGPKRYPWRPSIGQTTPLSRFPLPTISKWYGTDTFLAFNAGYMAGYMSFFVAEIERQKETEKATMENWKREHLLARLFLSLARVLPMRHHC